MIRLSNGHEFEYATASGALGFDGRGWPWEKPLIKLGFMDPSLFTIFTKTTTFDRRKGNLCLYKPWTCIRLIKDGVNNAVGLTNPGFMVWRDTYGFAICFDKSNIIASINQEENLERIELMATMLNDIRLVGAELNLSCPTFKHQTDMEKFQTQAEKSCEILATKCRHPLLVKLSVTHPMTLVNRLAPYAQAFDINSVPWNVVFPKKTSPLVKHGGGGVSGKAAQSHTWNYLSMLIQNTKVPIIGCSVWEYDDITRLRRRGAQAISFGAIHIPHPTLPTKFVKRDIQERLSKEFNPQTILHRL